MAPTCEHTYTYPALQAKSFSTATRLSVAAQWNCRNGLADTGQILWHVTNECSSYFLARHCKCPSQPNVNLHVVLEASCSSYLCFNGEVSCSSPPTRWCYLPIQQVTSPQKSRFLFISLSPLHEEMNVVLARDKNKTLVLQYYWPCTADRHDGAMFCPTGWRVAHVTENYEKASQRSRNCSETLEFNLGTKHWNVELVSGLMTAGEWFCFTAKHHF